MQRMEQVSEFKEKLVAVNRVTKVVKGGPQLPLLCAGCGRR